MRVALHLPPDRTPNTEFLVYERILQFNHVDSVRVHVDDKEFWQVLASCNAFVFNYHHFDDGKQIAESIFPVIEDDLKLKCFPNHATAWHYDDKIKQYYLLRNNNFPIVESWIYFHKEDALNWLESAEFPVVFKLKNGAGSMNVVLVRNKSQAKKLVEKMFTSGVHYGRLPLKNTTFLKDLTLRKYLKRITKGLLNTFLKNDINRFWVINKDYVMFQKFMPGNDFDTRIIVIGNHAYGEKRLNRVGDFRASGGGRLIFDPNEIDPIFVRTAFEISKKLGFQSMAYDFLYDPKGYPALGEISYTFPHQLFYLKCPGYWDNNLVWHEGHFSPQLFELEELLGIKLKQPDLFTEPI